MEMRGAEPHDPRPVSGPAVTQVRAESDVIGGHGGLALKKNVGKLGSSDLLPSQRVIFFFQEAQLTARLIFRPLSGELL